MSSTTGSRLERLDAASAAYETAAKPFLIVLFFALLVVPAFFYLGTLRLSFLRVFMLIMILPLIFRWLSGRYGGVIAPDFLLLGFSFWVYMSMIKNHGFSVATEFSAIQTVETMGPYLLARTYIRSEEAFRGFVRTLLWVVALLMPFALYESLTRTMLITRLFDALPGLLTFPNVNYEPRLGLFRAQATFEHPILFGVFCSSALALAWYVRQPPGTGGIARLFWSVIAFFGTFLSLSSGALLAAVVQVLLITYESTTRFLARRWRILTLVTGFFYVVIDLLSNRTPVTIFISIATFNSSTSWNRILIWDYGTAEVWRHPIFGIARNDWVRGHWMSASVDNFWLVAAMRSGLPSLFFLTSAIGLIMWRVGKRDFSASPGLQACQRGYLISLFGVIIGICTVHLWGGAYLYLTMLLGSGVWMISQGQTATTEPPETRPGRRAGRPRDRSRGPAPDAAAETDPPAPRYYSPRRKPPASRQS